MAKDPAYLFYPADASEDTQFMNRLERGCYFDLMKAQKKFNRFTMEQLKKVLGKDFEPCWPALEVVLKKDEQGYYIEWVDDAIKNRKNFTESRRKNRLKKSSEKDMLIISESNNGDMVNANENENTNALGKEGVGENHQQPNVSRNTVNTQSLIGFMYKEWVNWFPDYLKDGEDFTNLRSIAQKIADWLKMPGYFLDEVNQPHIKQKWELIARHCRNDGHLQRYSIAQVNKHFSSVIQSFNAHGKNNQSDTTGAGDKLILTSGGGFGKLR